MFRKIVFLILTCLCFVCCFGSNSSNIERDSIPYLSFQETPFIVVEAILDNGVKGLLALDSGTSSDKITLDSAFFYDNVDISKFTCQKPKFKTVFFREIYTGDMSINIGGNSFIVNEIEVRKYKATSIRKGLVGNKAFLDKITIINFEEKLIAFVDSLAVDSSYKAIPMYPPRNKDTQHSTQKFIEVSGLRDKHGKPRQARFLFDLGCTNAGLSVKNTFIKDIVNEKKNVTNQVSIGYDESLNKGTKWEIDSLFIGDIMLNNVSMKAHSKEYDPLEALTSGDGLLGLDILRRFHLIVDYKNNILYLKPNNNYQKFELSQ